ncbi:MAG: DUF4421 domain-containing protein [Paraprevotella sp.]|nr:DUF4421 domain-containing protein [Paraprevotella sp.]
MGWRKLLILYFLSTKMVVFAQSVTEKIPQLPPEGAVDSLVSDKHAVTDATASPIPPKRANIFQRFIQAFNAMDTTYITPNKYKWAFMLQNTNSFESYTLRSREYGQKLSFAPNPAIKIGPYFGWRWIFLGYTFQISSLGKGEDAKKTEFQLSLYSSMLGRDLIYRRTGNDFHIRKVKGFGEDAQQVKGTNCSGINVKVTGLNVYYIFNHKRFSYPAAFSQSTVQRKNSGSWKVGVSYTQHELDFDCNALPQELTHNPHHEFSQDFQFSDLKYTDISVSCGYAYNWVFKRNWLFCISVMPAIGYKKTHSAPIDTQDISSPASNLSNFNFDVIGRAGLVWNNTKYFGGLSLIVYNYNYRHSQLSINNTFGTLNLYIGLNFNKRKAYR